MKKSENKSTVIFAVILALILISGAVAGLITGMLIAKNNTGTGEKLPVSDVFSEVIKDGNISYCYHIPQIESDAEGIDEVNKNIYDTLYQVYSEGVTVSKKNNGFPVLGSMIYTCNTKDSVVSIIVQTQDARTLEYNYYTFNVDTEKGCTLSTEDMCELFGTEINAFNTKIRTAVKEYSDREKVNYPEAEINKYIEPIITKTLSKEYIDTASPYISRDGKLFAVVSLFSSGGKDTYPHMMNLDTAIPEEELPVCTAHDSLTEAITNAAAPVITPEPEVSYVYVEAETKKEPEKETEKETEKKEEVTTKKTTAPASSDVLTKEILMSHSWYITMQWSVEHIFLEDGTYEYYGASYGTGTYSIEGNILHLDKYDLVYTSIAESEDVRNDDYFMSFAKNQNVGENEKILYTLNKNTPMWLIDATNRFEADRNYSFYRNFALDNYESKWHNNYEDYLYAEFAMIDIDDDGTEELIVHEGTCEADRKYHFYTVKNKEVVYLGSLGAWHASLSENDGYLTKSDGMGGEGIYYKVEIENGKITENEEGSFSFPPTPDFGDSITFFPTMY